MTEIIFTGYLRNLTTVQHQEIDVKSVAALLKEIHRMYGRETYQVAKASHIIVNNQSISELNGFRTSLSSGDEVRIVPVCGGG